MLSGHTTREFRSQCGQPVDNKCTVLNSLKQANRSQGRELWLEQMCGRYRGDGAVGWSAEHIHNPINHMEIAGYELGQGHELSPVARRVLARYRCYVAVCSPVALDADSADGQ